MSVDKSLSALLSKSLGLVLSGEIQFWKVSMCTSIVCCRISAFLFVHSFSAPSLAVNGRVGCKFTPTVVRRGQTDWLHRLLCGNLGGYVAGLGYYSLAPHSSRASRLPTVQHCISPSCSLCQLSGWMYCGPAETISWSVW